MDAHVLSDVLVAIGEVAAAGGGEGHGESHGINWLLVGSLFTNAAIFFGFLYWMAAPAITNGLKSRRENMAVGLDRAREKQAEAEARLAEYQEKLDNLEREVSRVVSAYEKEAETDKARIEEETDRAIARLNRETEFTIQQETKKAEKLIQAAAVEATLRAAEEKIRGRIADEDHERITSQFVSSLKEGSL